MIATNHALTGALIGIFVPLPYTPLVALVSHFILDALPHFGNSDTVKPYTKPFKFLLFFDALGLVGVVIFSWHIAPLMWQTMAIGAIFAALPDVLWLFEKKMPRLKSYFTFAKRIQWSETPDGWTYELFYFSFVLLLLSLAL